MRAPENRVYAFGPFRLNPVEGVLLRDGKNVPLTPKAYEILVCMLEHAGHILEKDALMHAIWPDTFVEEGNLKVNISALRRALGDNTEEAAFIETIPRRGYRFVAQVQVADAVSSSLLASGPLQVTIEKRTLARTVTEEEETIEDTPPSGSIAPNLPEITVRSIPASVEPARKRKRLLWVAAAIAVALLFAAGTDFFFARLPGKFVRVTLSGRKLEAWDAKEHLAWLYEFPQPMEIAGMEGREGILLADLDGDGHNEVIAPLVFSPRKREGLPHGALFCFSDRGKLLWTYDPAVKLRFGRQEFGPPWGITALTLVKEGERQIVWVAFAHTIWWPAFVARIGPGGGADLRFINSGWIYFLKEFKTQPGDFLLAAGLNNGYRSASLAVLALNEQLTISPQDLGSPFHCDDCVEHWPLYYFLFPRSEIFDLQGQPFHSVASLETAGDGITIRTFEGKDQTLREIDNVLSGYYHIGRDFKKVTGALGDTYWNLHRKMEREGKIHHRAEDCPDQNILTRVRVAVRQSGWWTQREGQQAPASPPPE